MTTWPHSSSGVPATATSATSGLGAEHGLDRLRPHVLPAGDDQVAAPSVDVQPAVVEPPPEVAGRQPAVGERVRSRRGRRAAASARARGSARRRRCARRRRRAGARRRRRRCRSRSSRRSSRRSAAGRPAARRRRGRSCGTPPGRSAAARWPRATRASRPTAMTASGSNAGQHGERRPDDQRPGDDRQPADVGQRQAGQPVVVLGHAEPGARRPRRGGDGVVGEHDALGRRRSSRSSRRPGRRPARRAAVLQRHGVAAAVDDGAGAHRRQQGRLGRRAAAAGRPGRRRRRASQTRRGARRRTPGRPAGRGRRGGPSPEHGVDRGQRADGVLDGLGRGERGEVGEASRRELGADRQAVDHAARDDGGGEPEQVGRQRPGAALERRRAPPSTDGDVGAVGERRLRSTSG